MRFHRSCAALCSAMALVSFGCSSGGEDGPIEPTYANVESFVERTCAVPNCHGGTGRHEANLDFNTPLTTGRPITDSLVDVPSCEYDFMPRVDPGNPDNSWIMIKVDPANSNEDAIVQFTPDPDYDPETRAPACRAPGFGRRMPNVIGKKLSEREVEMFRGWIALGAPSE